MDEELIRAEIFREMRLKFHQARDESLIIPEVVFEILEEVEQSYK